MHFYRHYGTFRSIFYCGCIYFGMQVRLNMRKNERVCNQSSIPGEQLVELKKIGFIIRELRFNFGLLTQKELAERCGVHSNTIRTIEQGRRNYNLVSLMKIISYFEYDLPTFMKELI